jgi:hypothetical protein
MGEQAIEHHVSRQVVLKLVLMLALLSEGSLGQTDLVGGPWEVIPIAEDLEENTEYSVAYIDDLPGQPESTMDMFVFQPAHDVTW